jgi:4-amino-4-deoxy-L-arabinose transferase-like glycosyltransferase
MGRWSFVKLFQRLYAGIKGSKREVAIFACILLLGIFFRLLDITQPFIGDYTWNEAHYAMIARNFYEHNLLEQYTEAGLEYTSSPIVPWMIYASFKLFGEHEWAARLPIFILGIFSLCLLFLIAKELYSRRVALLAMFIAATAPGIVFYSWNIQPDGPMITCSLSALLTMIYFRRRGQMKWFILSLASLVLAVSTKYTAILMYPVLIRVWLGKLQGRRTASSWLLLVLYLVVPLILPATWIVWGQVHSSHPDVYLSFEDFAVRSSEWHTTTWAQALLSIWPNLSRQMGRILWCSILLVSPFLVLRVLSLDIAKRHITLILLTGPWFLQLIYPYSWIKNDYYTYPALYGLSILFALILCRVSDNSRVLLNLSRRATVTASFLALGLVVFSNVWDYKETYHKSFYPWYIVSQPEPFYSAKVVNSLNQGRETVLADVQQTVYYVGGDFRHTKRRWWGESDSEAIQAIESGQFKYLVFTYRPTIGIMNAIYENGYNQIAPAAWERAATP